MEPVCLTLLGFTGRDMNLAILGLYVHFGKTSGKQTHQTAKCPQITHAESQILRHVQYICSFVIFSNLQ